MSAVPPQPAPVWPSLAVAAVLAAAHAVAWVALLGFLCFSVPAYERVFTDFRLRLPGDTAAVIGASRWLNKYLLFLAPALLVLAAADGAVLFLLRRSPGTRLLAWLWFALLLLLPVAALVFSWLAVWRPYADL